MGKMSKIVYTLDNSLERGDYFCDRRAKFKIYFFGIFISNFYI